YRASGVDTQRADAAIFLYNPGNFVEVIKSNELVADGKSHIVTKDAIAAETLIVGVIPAGDEPASITIEAIDFEASPDAKHFTTKDDSPVTVIVNGPDEKPIQGATVIVDAERKDAARLTTTDQSGQTKM